jgi:hypothetical protein
VALDQGAREEQQRELARYHADYLAARAPLLPSLLSGAVAGLVVYLVPIGVVIGSFLLLSLSYAVTMPPAQLVVRGLRLGVYRPGRVLPTPTAGLIPPRATDVPLPTGAAGALDQGDARWVAAAGLVAFWPVAMLLIGAAAAAVYRARRARRLGALVRAPIDVPILGEVALFYALTAGAGLLVGIGTFVALGANLAFAWAGYLIWRWVHDRVLPRLVPAPVRAAALDRLRQESRYRRQFRERG